MSVDRANRRPAPSIPLPSNRCPIHFNKHFISPSAAFYVIVALPDDGSNYRPKHAAMNMMNK
jgi:hypothetical protein